MGTKRPMLSVLMITVVCATALPTLGVPTKERAWQEGKLIDIVSDPYTYGSVYKGTGGVHQGERITYVIDDGKYIYAASHTHRRHDKALPVTVNAKIKFAVEKSKVYILDEENEEHELKFVKKTLKDAAEKGSHDL